MKKVLAAVIIFTLLLLQIPAAVFASSSDLRAVLEEVNDFKTDHKAEFVAILSATWEYVAVEVKDGHPAEVNNAYDFISGQLGARWNDLVDVNNSTPDPDNKLEESTVRFVIQTVLDRKDIMVDLYDNLNKAFENTVLNGEPLKVKVKSLLGLSADASDFLVYSTMLEKSGEIITLNSENKFIPYGDPAAYIIGKTTGLTVDQIKIFLGARYLEDLNATIAHYIDSLNSYVDRYHVSINDAIFALELYNLYHAPTTTPPPGTATGGGGTTTPITTPGTITVNATLDSTGTAVAKIPAATITDAFSKVTAAKDGTKTITIKIAEIAGAKAYAPEIPSSALASGNAKERINIETAIGNITVPGNMFSAADFTGVVDVRLTIAITDASSVKDEAAKKLIGDRPVIELTASVGGVVKAWDNPDAPVTVAIKYKPTADELKAPDFITVFYIDGEGKVTAVPNAKYDAATGMVVFSVTHFSKYAVAYKHVTFTDLAKYSWAKDQIEVLASRGVFDVTGDTFAPQSIVTRDEFLGGVIRALGLSAKVDSNFSDVSKTNKYYTEIGVAKKLGITNGIGGNKFGAGTSITRQDMITLVVRAMNYAAKINETGSDADIAKFTDKAKISSYAKASIATSVKEGIIIGNNNAINPLGNLTKAEAAVVVYRVANK